MSIFTTQYVVPKLAEWFHSFPHINLTFQLANSTFEPKDASYQESLGFLVALPVLWLVLTFLIFTIYFCVRCCRKEEPRKKAKKVTCLQITMFVFVVLTCGCVAVCFYGNDDSDKGIMQFTHSVENVNKTVNEAVDRIGMLQKIVHDINSTGLPELIESIKRHVSNETVKTKVEFMLQDLRKMADVVEDDMHDVKNKTLMFRLDNISSVSNAVEYIRWVSTICIWCWNVLACLLFLLGAVKKSKGLLIASVVLGLVDLIFVWTAGGLYLGASVGAGDLCVNPDPFIEQQADPSVRGIVHQYLTFSSEDPFSEQTEAATTAVTTANGTVTRVLQLVAPYNISKKINRPVKFVRTNLKFALTVRISIDNYVDALHGFCHRALFGFALMLVGTGAVGLMVTVLVCLASKAWPHCSKKRGYYPVDDTDPFLPRPPPYNGYGTMPGGSMSSIPGNVSRADVTVYPNSSAFDSDIEVLPLRGPPSDSPPPCYTYMEQYSNLGRPIGQPGHASQSHTG
ncbi:protein tweety homolog 2-like [Liolophura sinensis]|uniref:protein tweety homolog 2-like n=1 Tax=Liolophura sinensis TaxID=3198878 RepID=UPI003158615E